MHSIHYIFNTEVWGWVTSKITKLCLHI